MTDSFSPPLPPAERLLPDVGFGGVHVRALGTLMVKETARYLKVPMQTLVAPAITALLIFTVFGLSAGGATARSIGGVPFLSWLLPGLVMMTVAQQAFSSTSSALILGKMQGYIVDLVMAPLSPFEWTAALALSGLWRGLIVGVLTTFTLFLLHPVAYAQAGLLLFYAIAGALMMSLLGLLTGLWSDKFDDMMMIQSFIVAPATFLSGTFLPASQLPGVWGHINAFNPLFYAVDGFRQGLAGAGESDPALGMAVMVVVNVVLFGCAMCMIARARKLKN